jgi:hypothetical protein
MKEISILLVMVALIAGMIGCGGGTPTQYTLSISSTPGGNVTHPGTGTFIYPTGAVVLLEAVPDDGYGFTHWSGNVSAIDDVNALTTTITMNGHYFITANFAYGQLIRTWYDLDDIRDDLGGYYILMNDLDSSTAGYTELASDVANQGKGWQPIGYEYWNGEQWVEEVFQGTFDGQGYEISDLFIDRPDEDGIGLFGRAGEGGMVKNIGIVDADVTGLWGMGGLVGLNEGGTVSNAYSTGSVIGEAMMGGLVGFNEEGTVGNSHSTCSVSGYYEVGGVIGVSVYGTVSNCYGAGNVVGEEDSVGGLLGSNYEGTVTDCYATGSVTGNMLSGGLVGRNDGTVDDCYSTGSVNGSGEYGDMIGGLVGDNRGTVSNSYATGDVTGQSCIGGLMGPGWGNVHNSYYNYDEVLINGEKTITLGALFSADFEEWLANDKFLDVNEKLSKEGDYYVINDINDFQQLLAFGQDNSLRFRLTDDLDLSAEPNLYIPYLAGEFDGDGHIMSNLSFGLDFIMPVGLFGFLTADAEVRGLGVENVNVAGGSVVGALAGENMGTVSNSYTTGVVTGESEVGGLMGGSFGTVTDCYSTCNITGEGSIGGLMGGNYGTVSDCYATGTITGSNDRVAGLMGWNSGVVSNSHATGSVVGSLEVGGLVGFNHGNVVSNCYSTGNVTGDEDAGGLVGRNSYYNTTVSNCYATGSVTRSSGENTDFGGFAGWNQGKIINCYSGGSVHYEGVADPTDKGFAGRVDTGGDYEMTGNFWDTQTSGQVSTAGNATGKTTAEMQDISTFSGAFWNIIGVANPSIRNLSYVWNIVNNVTYPFLSWEP